MAGYISGDTRKVTTHRLVEMKQRGEKISMLTSYDYTTAQIVDGAGIDVILVGDSASNVMAGNVTTLPITLDQMIYHGKSVVRGVKRALVVVDLPFGTYQTSEYEAVTNAIKVMKITHADALKLEGGVEIIDAVKKIIAAGIPIMGHLGLMPQSINKYGTYTVRAKDEEDTEKLLSDAHLLEETGCFALVLEKIPASLAERVLGTDYSRYRYRSRWRGRRAGAGSIGHAGDDQRFQSSFPPSLCRSAYSYDGSHTAVCG